MSSGARELQEAASNKVSRRALLKTAGILGVTGPGFANPRPITARAAPGPLLAYVGCYSSQQGPEGNPGRGQGIYLFEMNPTTGVLTQRDLFPNPNNPSWLTLDATRTHLYSTNATQTYEGASSGSVSAYSLERPGGRLTLLNTVSSHGAGPTYVSLHPSGKYALVANYHGGTVTVLPILPNGALAPAADVHHNPAAVGPTRAASAPPGSFAISGHDRSHAHMVLPDPSGRFVLSADLGTDQILVWKFDAEVGKLSPNDPPAVALPPGDGPRHFAFHPNGRWLYSLQEEASTLQVYDFDAASGSLMSRQTISTLPPGFAGTNFTSEVVVSPDGRFVYAANRLHDSIAWFAIREGGTLSYEGEEWTRGDYPRSFTIDPTGSFLYSCNQRSDAIATFRIARRSGKLTFTGQYTPVGTPAIVLFLT